MIRILHNEHCSKSTCALQLLQESQLAFEVRNYLEQPLTVTELTTLVGQLGIPAEELVRKNEPEYLAHFAGKTMRDEDWVAALAAYPALLQRPILIQDGKAFIGRPPERILTLLQG